MISAVAGFARACSLACAVALASCSATDVVARRDAESRCRADAGLCPPDADETPEAGETSDAGESRCEARACSTLGTRDRLCRSAPPTVQAGDSCGASGGSPASRFALCTCTDLVTHAPLRVDAFSGTLAQSASELPRLGINGNLTLDGVDGVNAEILVRGRIDSADGGVLRPITATASAPCGCDAASLLDIAAIARARARDNDNAAAGLVSTQLDGFRGAQTLTLECGRYYFTRLKGDEAIAIRARGNVAIFVASNIELGDALSVQTEDSASQVSLFVAGDMHVGGTLSLGGDPNGSARVDLYLASEGTLEIAGAADLAGRLYAPHAELVSTGTFQIYGSLFVRRAAPGAEFHVHYDERAALPVACALP
jgi:hypothetical protein